MDLDLWLRFAKVRAGGGVDTALSLIEVHHEAKTVARQDLCFAETCLVFYKNGEFDLAKEKIARVARRAYEAAKIFSPFTRNPLYRWWRKLKEHQTQGLSLK